MSEKGVRTLNILPVPEPDKRNVCPSNGSVTDDHSASPEKSLSTVSVLSSSASANGSTLTSTGEEAGATEVEYIESKNLPDLPAVDESLETLLVRLDSKDWVLTCEALNNVRQLSIYHKERLTGMLVDVVPLITKSLKSPRSAVCKTAIMTSADLFRSHSDMLIDTFDTMLMQLLLKASQDKRFVCEAAERALVEMTTWLSPLVLLPKLQPYLKHKNPRIRAKASLCFSRTVPQLGVEGIKEFGIDKLIQVAASQLSDQLPESREAARTLALELQGIYIKSQVLQVEEAISTTIEEDREDLPAPDSWEVFCHSKLSPLNAQAILRVTSVPKERLVVGC